MQVEVFCVCSSAVVRDGELDIRGIYCCPSFPVFPADAPEFTIAARMRFELSEQGTHDFLITVADPKGLSSPNPVKGRFDATAIAGQSHAWVNALVGRADFRFSEPGVTTLTLHIDGKPVATYVMCVSRR